MTELRLFRLNFREVFPPFTRQAPDDPGESLSFNDTRTVGIIGFGKRVETLVSAAAGEGLDGEPTNFDPRLEPSGCFFKTTAFPVYANTFKVFRGTSGLEEVSEDEFLLDEVNGYFVLYTPLVRGERLVVEYISEADVNTTRVFTEEQLPELYSIYGSPSQENTLSAAAEIAVANGAPRLIVVQGDHTGNDPAWFQAYEALERTQVYMIVPMQNRFYSQVALAGLDHVERMSETPFRRERILILGEKPKETPEDENDLDALPREAVKDFNGEERVVFVGADFPLTVIAGETTAAVGGYLAAAVAGRWAGYEYIPTTLYLKQLNRILLDWPQRDLYSEAQLRQLAREGLTLLLQREGTSIVNHFVTTIANFNPVDEEPSLWRIRDYVAIEVRRVLENRYVGSVVTQEVVEDVKNSTIALLQGFVDQKILTKYSGVQVSVDQIEPRQVNVAFDIEPVFPLNDIVLNISVKSFL